MRVQVSFGTAWEVSGNYSAAQTSGSSRSVAEQSGLFAGQGGYHIRADQVHLKGGAIASAAPAEHNELTANRLTFENLHNHSDYSAQSAAISGGYGHNPGIKQKDGSYKPEIGYSNGPQYNPGLPQSDSGSSESTTYAVLSEGDIRIGGERTTAQALGIRTRLDGANESIAALPDLQRLLQQQRTVSQASADIIGAAQTYSSNRAKEAEQQKQQAEHDFRQAEASGDTLAQAEASARIKQAEQTKQEWGVGGSKSRALQAASTLIVGTLGGQTDMQVAANTLAPYAAAAIGRNFGHGENKNETAQVLGHFLLGAALAYVNGADPLSGGSAAIASEKTAEYLAAQYNDGVSYNNEAGEFEPNRLPENVKQEIRAITGAIGTLVGGVSGSAHHGNGNAVDVLTNAQVGGVVGQNTVVNNDLAFSPNSDKNASARFRRKISQELGGKFELVNTGRRTSLDYEIMELRPIENYTIADLSPEQLRFYNMLNGIIKDSNGSSNITLVDNDPRVIGGSWRSGKFDVSDMEKLDSNKIVLSGNVLIAHEFYEQLAKSKLGLQPNSGTGDKNYQNSHNEAITQHEPKVLPSNIRYVGEDSEVNGVYYDKIYFDEINKQLIGIDFGMLIGNPRN